jgi:hypothetical protein
MKVKYNDAMNQKQILQEKADACKKKMNVANALISGLQVS